MDARGGEIGHEKAQKTKKRGVGGVDGVHAEFAEISRAIHPAFTGVMQG
jgi:hypothetical protein